jgi:prephenate dehydrogenase
LFVNRVVVLTPAKKSKEEDCQTLTEFWSALGARITRMSPAAHDKALAATSHLPHLAASALAAATPAEDLALAASGWADTTRVAAGDAALWTQIFLSNQAQVLTALGRYEKVLTSFRSALQRGDAAKLERILAEAKQKRDALGS